MTRTTNVRLGIRAALLSLVSCLTLGTAAADDEPAPDGHGLAAGVAIANSKLTLNPARCLIPADEGGFVRLVTGGPLGFGTQPHGLPIGAPARVFHVPWQEGGVIGGTLTGPLALWPVNNHGVSIPRPAGAQPWTVMDHTIVVVYEGDAVLPLYRKMKGNDTPLLIAEMLPEGEGNWNVHERGSPKFEQYMEEMKAGKLVAGKSGHVRPVEVGRVYGLGDHSCIMEAENVVGWGYGPGARARGLSKVGLYMKKTGTTAVIRNSLQAAHGGLRVMGTAGTVMTVADAAARGPAAPMLLGPADALATVNRFSQTANREGVGAATLELVPTPAAVAEMGKSAVTPLQFSRALIAADDEWKREGGTADFITFVLGIPRYEGHGWMILNWSGWADAEQERINGAGR
jgi:hypothetical protein